MGSSKKHKEKDREHKHKRKHRSRDRSRSGSKERRHRDREVRDKDRDRERIHGEKRRRVEREPDEELARAQSHEAIARSPSPVVPKKSKKEEEESTFTSSGGGATLSLSIQQANEVRAKLGLKPLEVNDGSEGTKQDGVSTQSQDVHKPAVNMAAVKKTAELRDKMENLREKRRVQELLNKVKTLGEDSDDEDSAVAWVVKSRKIEEERRQAEQRAKMLEEMDAEFGIGGLLEEEFGTKKKHTEYSSRDLKGLKVEHDQEMFKEGKTVILTLKDKGILDEDADDTLVNVNIIDDERAAINIENKKKKPTYQAYDEDEFDDHGMLKVKEILDKYDEVIDGKKKESFQLDDVGRYDTIYERRMRDMKTSVQSQSERLELPPMVIANEYYTPAEMEAQNKFKKTSRKAKKLRKKERVTADDLLNLEVTDNDLGSRRTRSDADSDVQVKTEPAIPGLDFVNTDEDMLDEKDLMTDDMLGPSEDLTGVVVDEDTAALELELALNKARRLNQNKFMKRSNEKDIIGLLRAEIIDSTPDLASSISLNSTSEFCRSLGDIPTFGQSGNRDSDEEEEMMEFDKDQAANRQDQDDDDEQGGGTGWQSVEIDSRPVDLASMQETSVLDEEPVVKHGLAGALLLARKKGYLDHDEVQKSAPLNPTVADLHAQNYSIEDKKLDDDDKHRKRDRYIGSGGMEFKEKEGYKPDVKLDYVDDGGRTMTPKEAFRMLSHRFHGKGSGKKKTEKRMKKIEEDQLMRSMSSTDTPLNTAHLLQERQKADKVPYIVLSGGKGLASNNIAK